MKENKKKKCCERNFERKIFRRIALESRPTNTLDEDHDCFGALSSNSPLRVVQYIYRISVISFREQKSFVLKTVILLAFGIDMCDGVGEDSGHGIGHVDILVGSCNCLDVIVCHDMCT